MRKALIFVCAFVVSSMIIYMVYYYSQVNKLNRGIVALATELPKTIISPIQPKHFSDSNYIGSLGLLQAKKANEKHFVLHYNGIPEANYLSANGIFSKNFQEQVNIGISGKFPNHPPIGFPNVKDGEKVLFSYFFRNVILPEGFANTNAISIGNKYFRALQYIPADSLSQSVKANMQPGGPVQNIFINADNSKTLLVFSKTALTDSSFSAAFNSAALPAEAFIFPEADFNIIKYYKAGEAYFLTDENAYKHLEERVKLKLSAPQDDMVANTSKVELHPPYFMYLYKTGETKPYFMLYVADTEILLPVRQ